jgi:hypothetical protein
MRNEKARNESPEVPLQEERDKDIPDPTGLREMENELCDHKRRRWGGEKDR